MRRAFTILELLVATMLLAMLVTILTMIFNQSSVAWTIGVASLTGLDDIRRRDAVCCQTAENAIRRDLSGGQFSYVTSVFASNADTDSKSVVLRTRAVSATNPDAASSPPSLSTTALDDPMPNQTIALGSGSANRRAAYIVGVTSWGPDGEQGTWDDITTMPEEIVK